LPRSVIAELQEGRDKREKQITHIDNATERQQRTYLEERRSFGRWDSAFGPRQR